MQVVTIIGDHTIQFLLFLSCFKVLVLRMTAKGGASRPACAACKHQRRKCTADCPLALYFPADQPRQFQNAHRLFGVSNILRILKDLDPVQKSEAMKSILYEANVREHFPVLGCVGLIFDLQYKIYQVRVELDNINYQIAALAALNQNDQYYQSSTHIQLAPSSSSASLVPLAPAIDNLNTETCVADVTNYDNNNEMKFVDPIWANQMHTNNIAIENSITTATEIQLSFEAVSDTIEQEYEEISPYFDTINEKRAKESRISILGSTCVDCDTGADCRFTESSTGANTRFPTGERHN